MRQQRIQQEHHDTENHAVSDEEAEAIAERDAARQAAAREAGKVVVEIADTEIEEINELLDEIEVALNLALVFNNESAEQFVNRFYQLGGQ